ncbi:MAG: sigma-54-dependent Fis family transcriptional regulator [Acidobacteria bacterium]|nr:sigma-54-dependent Fis family transcriptional regulator [Acidobacteriota bacterium]
MPKKNSLHGSDRDFLNLLADAAAANPFTDTYAELASKIADCAPETPAAEVYQRIVARVSEEVSRMESAGLLDLRRHSGADGLLLRYAIMFDVYHRFLPELDRLIAAQSAETERSLPVPFAADLLHLLSRRGFAPGEARRLFAILYQIRRAFFFIDRGLVGRSESMKRLRRHLWNNVFTHDIRMYERQLWDRMEDFSTLLLGETGTGKGAAAAAIGRSAFIPCSEKTNTFAESFARGFVALNLSQYPESLVESELFGHRKGAFTGAIEAHEGILARCSPYGAIFLDEIGDASVETQIRLLRVLEERAFSPVGSHETARFRGRIIAATNQPLDTLRRSGRFREDFFYRLSSDVITVPPLRQRLDETPADLDDLVSLTVDRITGARQPETIAAVLASLAASPGHGYAWPGNVRELAQAVRRILLKGTYEGDSSPQAPDLCATLQEGIAAGTLEADALMAGYCRLLYGRLGSYEAVARRLHLDRRTVKAHIQKIEVRER